MSSGTDAQLAILMAMGIGPGDAVITTPYTFFATAGCIHRVGAEAVFVDVSADTLHMDPAKLRELLERCDRDPDGSLISPRGLRLRAVIPIHLFGSCCPMDAIKEVVAPYGLPIIEDAAQAIGSEYPGEPVARAGALGDSAFFSFFPTKNLGAAGDAGMSVCQDAEFAEKLRLVRNHGMEQRYFHRMVGGNFRIDALQAAVLHAKLYSTCYEWNAGRRKNAELYRELLSDLEESVTLPAEPWRARGVTDHHTYHQYVIRAQRRDELMKHLAAAEIGCAIYYPVPLHRQECFAYLGYAEGDFPVSERAGLGGPGPADLSGVERRRDRRSGCGDQVLLSSLVCGALKGRCPPGPPGPPCSPGPPASGGRLNLWSAIAFCRSPSVESMIQFFGSAAFTAANDGKDSLEGISCRFGP